MNMEFSALQLLIFAASSFLLLIVVLFWLGAKQRRTLENFEHHQQTTLHQLAAHQQEQLGKLRELTQQSLSQQLQALTQRQDNVHALLRRELSEQIHHQNQHIHREIQQLASLTEQRINRLNEQVEQRLAQGVNTSQQTFKDILSRLSRMDEAQKRLEHLAGDVRGLHDILTDNRSRGAFGEAQLQTRVDKLIPAQHVRYQQTLGNGKRPDCLLTLPEPTGQIAIDAKFPLESYRRLVSSPENPQSAIRQFRQDIRKHIHDIAEKYILPPETANGAILFIPAEAVFAEIHAHHSELIDEAHRLNVWLTSPTTLAAILTSARSVIKDDATRRQAHLLREQLQALDQDFALFQQRMTQLVRHMDLAQRDVNEVHHSAKKIASQFRSMEDPDQLANHQSRPPEASDGP